MTTRVLLPSHIGPQDQLPQTDGVLLKAGLSVWEIEGRPPVLAVSHATKGELTSVIQQGCNSLEIDSVTMHSFLGVRYARVVAHTSHSEGHDLTAESRLDNGVDLPAARRSKWVL